MKWMESGRPGWGIETTMQEVIDTEGEFERRGKSPAPRFRQEYHQDNYAFVRKRVLGCRSLWLRPYRALC